MDILTENVAFNIPETTEHTEEQSRKHRVSFEELYNDCDRGVTKRE